jgi:tetratricopeptide (TPR) repeat protein
MKHTRDRSVIYANRAACLMKMEKYEAAIQSCTKSIELDSHYIKAFLRRAESYKHIDKLEDALQDYQKILELDPNNSQARREVYILPDQIKERNEKLKDEMLGKLKELGNMVLKPFGLSTNNFKLQQDPTTGSYNVNFQK